MDLFLHLAIGVHIGMCLSICGWLATNWKLNFSVSILHQVDKTAISTAIKNEVEKQVQAKVTEVTKTESAWHL